MNPVETIAALIEDDSGWDYSLAWTDHARATAERLMSAVTDDGWRIVRTDPNTEPDERPIVIEEWRP